MRGARHNRIPSPLLRAGESPAARRARLALGLAGIAVAWLAAGAGPAPAALSADSMYRPDTVVVIDLTLPPASVAALEADPVGQYVEGTLSVAETGGTPETIGAFSAPLTVGIRLKGTTSFRPLSGKAAFKLKMNSFVKGQQFLGLRKMTLNNMVQDPSMAHEALAYEAFRAAGVQAPRTGFAYVRVNGEDFGLHLNLETMDEVALEKRYGEFEDPPQHLYEGVLGADVRPGGASGFEVDEGDEGDRSDLTALIDALAAPEPAGFLERMAPVADVEQMTTTWAVEKYIDHWDGYSSRVLPNNYYLYSDPAGVFQMLPSGTDQTWSDDGVTFGGKGGTLFEACLEDPGCTAMYRSALEAANAAILALDLDSRLSAIAALLEPWQETESAPRKTFGEEQIEFAVQGVRDFLVARPAALAAWLAGPPPTGGGATEAGTGEPPVLGLPQPRPRLLTGRLDVDRSRLARGLLITRLVIPSPGLVTQDGELSTSSGPRRVCASAVRAAAAGVLTVRCRLAGWARQRLAARRLTIQLETHFQAGNDTDSVARSVDLPRQS